jgi:hypothetical protein
MHNVKIKFADDCIPCPDCGEPWCEEHAMHYSDCACIGPSNAEDFGEVVEIDGELYCVVPE